VYAGHPLDLYFGISDVLLGTRRGKTGKVFHFYPGKLLREYPFAWNIEKKIGEYEIKFDFRHIGHASRSGMGLAQVRD
jgi:hypothetical protein